MAKEQNLAGIERASKTGLSVSVVIVLAALAIWAIVFKVPASTDDWHWGTVIKQGNPLPLIDPYCFRLPVCKVLFNLTLPVILRIPLLGKLLVWSIGIIGIALPLSWFFKRYGLNLAHLPPLAFFAFFAPGQYELNYNQSSMPFAYGLLFVGLGFLLFRKGNRWLGTILYLLSFFTLESFITLAILLELSARAPDLAKKETIKRTVLDLAVLFSPYVLIRLALHFAHPYQYDAGLALHFGQLKGLVIQSFFITFFKTNWILSFLQLILYLVLGYGLVRRLAPEKRNSWAVSLAALVLFFFMGSSYYLVLSYPAGRALIGQIAFGWGAYLLLVLSFVSGQRAKAPVKVLALAAFLSVQVVAQVLIFKTKAFNYCQIRTEVATAQTQLAKSHGAVDLDPAAVRARFQRDWIFSSDADVIKMFEYSLPAADFARLRFIDPPAPSKQ